MTALAALAIGTLLLAAALIRAAVSPVTWILIRLRLVRVGAPLLILLIVAALADATHRSGTP